MCLTLVPVYLATSPYPVALTLQKLSLLLTELVAFAVSSRMYQLIVAQHER